MHFRLSPSSRFPAACLLVAGLALQLDAHSSDLRPTEAYIEAGRGNSQTSAGAVGLSWDLPWTAKLWSGEVSTKAEVFVSQWRPSDSGFHGNPVQVGAVPYLRYRPDGGRSPWFVEIGIGVSYLDRPYATSDRRMGSQWNFSDNLAIGRNFGPSGQHAWSVRVQHSSNAGLKQPNPGMTLGMIRLSTRF